MTTTAPDANPAPLGDDRPAPARDADAAGSSGTGGRWAVALHESGHVAAALSFGAVPTIAAVHGEGHGGSCYGCPPAGTWSGAIVAMAGPAAEVLADATAPPPLIDPRPEPAPSLQRTAASLLRLGIDNPPGLLTDRAVLAAYVTRLHPADWSAAAAAIIAHAERIVAEHAAFVLALAGELFHVGAAEATRIRELAELHGSFPLPNPEAPPMGNVADHD